jgi:hypothetical protein
MRLNYAIFRKLDMLPSLHVKEENMALAGVHQTGLETVTRGTWVLLQLLLDAQNI